MSRFIRRRRDEGNEVHKGTVKIGALFEKYKKRLRPPQGIVVSAFCAIVEDELGATLSPAQVRYNVHTGVISVTTSGPLKSEIRLRQKRLLSLCRDTLGDLGAPKSIV